jgi:hypothetical protein
MTPRGLAACGCGRVAKPDSRSAKWSRLVNLTPRNARVDTSDRVDDRESQTDAAMASGARGFDARDARCGDRDCAECCVVDREVSRSHKRDTSHSLVEKAAGA